MTTQITTLEQAELVLRRNNAVVVHNEADYVEGKKLLDICGFSYIGTEGRNNSKLILDRQIERHSLVSGQDFTVNIDVDGRIRRSVYYFTVNSANHILLAAMTNEGREARQEAIDMRTQQQQEQQERDTTTPPMSAFAMIAALANEAEQQRLQLLNVQQITNTIEERTTTVEQRMSAIESTVADLGTAAAEQPQATTEAVPAGHLTLAQIRETVTWMSATKVEEALSQSRWPYTYYTYRNNPTTKAYVLEKGVALRMTVFDLFDKIRREARPVGNSSAFYSHYLVPGKFQINL